MDDAGSRPGCSSLCPSPTGIAMAVLVVAAVAWVLVTAAAWDWTVAEQAHRWVLRGYLQRTWDLQSLSASSKTKNVSGSVT